MPDRTLARLNDLEGWRYRHQTHEIGPTPGEVYGMFMGLPRLRGLWILGGSTTEAQSVDQSGQGRLLSWAGTIAEGVYNDVVPYLEYNGTTGYNTRPDEAGLDITGLLTIGGWFWFDNAASAVENVMGKRTGAGNLSYYLSRLASGLIKFEISDNGTNVSSDTSVEVVGAGAWKFLVGRYTPSTEQAVFVNGVKSVTTAGIKASIFNSTAAFTIGANATPGEFLDGRASICFLCSSALSDNLLSLLFNRSRSLYAA